MRLFEVITERDNRACFVFAENSVHAKELVRKYFNDRKLGRLKSHELKLPKFAIPRKFDMVNATVVPSENHPLFTLVNLCGGEYAEDDDESNV